MKSTVSGEQDAPVFFCCCWKEIFDNASYTFSIGVRLLWTVKGTNESPAWCSAQLVCVCVSLGELTLSVLRCLSLCFHSPTHTHTILLFFLSSSLFSFADELSSLFPRCNHREISISRGLSFFFFVAHSLSLEEKKKEPITEFSCVCVCVSACLSFPECSSSIRTPRTRSYLEPTYLY